MIDAVAVVSLVCALSAAAPRTAAAAPILSGGESGLSAGGLQSGAEATGSVRVPAGIPLTVTDAAPRRPADTLRSPVDKAAGGGSLESVLRAMIAVRPQPPSRAHPQGSILGEDPTADPWEERGVAVVYRALLNSQMLGDVARAFVEPEVLENGAKAFSVLGFGRFSLELGSDDDTVSVQQGGLPADWPSAGVLSSPGRNPGSPSAVVARTTPAFVRVLRAVREFVVSPEGIVCLSFVGWVGLMAAAVRAGLHVQQRRRSGMRRNTKESGRRRRSADRRGGRKAAAPSKAEVMFGVSERRCVPTGRAPSPPGR